MKTTAPINVRIVCAGLFSLIVMCSLSCALYSFKVDSRTLGAAIALSTYVGITIGSTIKHYEIRNKTTEGN
jgi:hypothetical protein